MIGRSFWKTSFAAVISLLAITSWAEGKGTVLGWGTINCVDYSALKSEESNRVDQWIFGYLSSLSLIESSDGFSESFGDISTKTLRAVIAQTCKVNPGMKVFEATQDIYRQLGGKKFKY